MNKKHDPLVSVLMAVYNGEKYIAQSIESILIQTFQDFEFIIIDDGSKDNSLKIIKEYQNKDNRIKFIENKENIGLPASLNKGLEIAKGKYIAREDADDFSLPERLRLQCDYMENHHSISLLGADCGYIDINGHLIYETIHFSQIKDFFNNILNQKTIFPHGVAFIRTETIKALGGYNENFYYSQDVELWLRFIKNNYKLAVLPKIIYLLRLTSEKNKKKSYGQEQFGKFIRNLYLHPGPQKEIDNIINTKSGEILKRVNKDQFKGNKNYLANYWFFIARLSIRKTCKISYTWHCLVNSLREHDYIVNHLKKIFWFIIPLLPSKLVIKFEGKLKFLK